MSDCADTESHYLGCGVSDTSWQCARVGGRVSSIQTEEPLILPLDTSNPHPQMSDHLKFYDGKPFSLLPQHLVLQQTLTPAYGFRDRTNHSNRLARVAMSTGQAECLESLFSLAGFGDQSYRVSSGSQSSSSIKLPLDNESDDSGDPENVQVAMIGFLSLDRHVESNGLPYLLQTCARWATNFLFEPRRITLIARSSIMRRYTMGEDYRRTMNLLANDMYEITRSADYDLANSPDFSLAEAAIRQMLTEGCTPVKASRELDMQHALKAMLFTFEFISFLCKAGSLVSVLSTMQLAAPVFRRACPDPLGGLVNLPPLLASMIVPLQHFGSLDTLLCVLTGRPMFLRYQIEFTPETPESLFCLENGPGLRWLYGVPDRLLLVLAQMNNLFEDFGSRVQKEVVDELEKAIKHMNPIIDPSTEPHLFLARVAVQECWFLAALIYLYMGLCGAGSMDNRVLKCRAQVMRILASVSPKRNPDSFLIFPLIIVGVATDNPNEQNIIRQRMLGVSECSRQGTMGNDFIRVLNHLWASRHPAVWGDLRRACWEVLGI